MTHPMKQRQYLDVQAQLLVAVDALRRLPLSEFAEAAESLHQTQLAKMARGAVEMCSHGPLAELRSKAKP
jgi:hypothetical protein